MLSILKYLGCSLNVLNISNSFIEFVWFNALRFKMLQKIVSKLHWVVRNTCSHFHVYEAQSLLNITFKPRSAQTMMILKTMNSNHRFDWVDPFTKTIWWGLSISSAGTLTEIQFGAERRLKMYCFVQFGDWRSFWDVVI